MTSPLITESAYPIEFRKKDAALLGEHLRLRHSVELIGMKRVGISNFLRFFLYHKDIVSTYISKTEKHLFIPVDLNDLVERELQPFWILTLKRVSDAAEASTVPNETKKKIQSLFLQSIQIQDNFLTTENIKNALLLLISEGFIPTLFLLRFDRMKEAATPEFLTNIQSLIDATNKQVAFVFTSVRPLDQIREDIFSRKELSTFSHLLYLHPASNKDAKIIFQSAQGKYGTHFSPDALDTVLKLSGGHAQYLYLSQIILYEKQNEKDFTQIDADIEKVLLSDERIKLQSEEIFESLTKPEQDVLKKISTSKEVEITPPARYLEDTGIVVNSKVFSPLFATFLATYAKNHKETIEFSKKEHKLFSFLKKNIDTICERDDIIHAVWPEYEETGVSDWTIDRLVARLRQKLILQKSPYSVVTIKTRGYKLIES